MPPSRASAGGLGRDRWLDDRCCLFARCVRVHRARRLAGRNDPAERNPAAAVDEDGVRGAVAVLGSTIAVASGARNTTVDPVRVQRARARMVGDDRADRQTETRRRLRGCVRRVLVAVRGHDRGARGTGRPDLRRGFAMHCDALRVQPAIWRMERNDHRTQHGRVPVWVWP